MKLRVLTGLGIECEKESLLFCRRPEFKLDVSELPIPFLLRKPDALNDLAAGDMVFFAGGFSFADHFGSGRLLAYELKKTGTLDALLKRGVHLMGVCNGFQVLAAAGLFGPKTRLEPNEVQGKRLGFINRWVDCELRLGEPRAVRLPVRHGEGRLVVEGVLPQSVEPFLTYTDPIFDNGSWERVAGLKARHGRSLVFGSMPHPEIAARPMDEPDVFATDVFESQRPPLALATGPGVDVFSAILKELS